MRINHAVFTAPRPNLLSQPFCFFFFVVQPFATEEEIEARSGKSDFWLQLVYNTAHSEGNGISHSSPAQTLSFRRATT
jgi:hypothetical protein